MNRTFAAVLFSALVLALTPLHSRQPASGAVPEIEGLPGDEFEKPRKASEDSRK
jgi:hypothetical protein